MEDRFKFRAWHKEDEKMGYQESLSSHRWDCAPPTEIQKKDKDWTWCEQRCFYTDVNFGRVILMQCTGLRDKNGNLIYEGDILHHDMPLSIFGENTRLNEPVIVEYVNSAFGVYFNEHKESGHYLNNVYHMCTIIGNIYENPELLGDGDVSN